MLGAHVSTSGGVATALARGLAIGASAIQVFTKTPNQWREPVVGQDTADAFRREVARTGITHIVSHDSYLINLASPDPALRERSEESFGAELDRSERLGIRFVVSHPGNFIDDRAAGSGGTRSPTPAASVRCRGSVGVLLETTAGTGTALGSTLRGAGGVARRDRRGCAAARRLLRRHLPPLFRGLRPGAATSTASGGDGRTRSVCRSSGACTSTTRRRRSARAATGTSSSPRARSAPSRSAGSCASRVSRAIIKILETPKGDDEFTQDRRMLRRLRAYARVRPAR